ncbi:MAG: sulfate adenylyltransferase subunit 2 [Bdellovibrionales bacterium]|nr:sulfate adenylyltransferase subunit 2 [Bdellovibrionales bacterium]
MFSKSNTENFSAMHQEERLRRLENESLYVIREAYRKFPRLALLWSMGKDSTVMLWLARKAFFGRVPFPVVHIDTSYKFPEMVKYRDEKAREWGLDFQLGSNAAALKAGMGPEKGRLQCCKALKTDGLKSYLAEKDYRAVFVAIRRDEEGSRGKERVFSPRDAQAKWDYREQPPELWNHYQTEAPPGSHIRVHPILHWTELDMWLYIKQENIPVLSLYFAKNGQRYRSVGCAPCTGATPSNASTIDEIIEELRTTQVSERAGRAQDHVGKYAMQKLREEGYM